MLLEKYEFELFADYNQFYLQDEKADGDLSDSWTEKANEMLLAITNGTIGVGTVRNMDVPVTVEIHDTEPTENLELWDQVNECSIEIPSGRIVIAGCTDYFPEASRIEVEPATYQARIYYGDLNILSEDELEGNDNYKIALWCGEVIKPKIIKQRINKD